MPRSTDISNSDDVIDSRAIIDRIDELDVERTDLEGDVEEARASLQEAQEALDGWEGAEESEELLAARNKASETFDNARNALDEWDEDNAGELKDLKALAEEAEGYAEDWRHGATLIREDYFPEYAQQLCADLGDLPRDIPSYIEIDWEKTAENLKVDYTEVEFSGVTYLVR